VRIIKEQLKQIREIENKYGLMVFRMGLTHLVDVGHRNVIGDVDVAIRQIMAEGENTSIMTPELKCGILRCAAELTEYSIWTLFAYIKKYVEIGGVKFV